MRDQILVRCPECAYEIFIDEPTKEERASHDGPIPKMINCPRCDYTYGIDL
jgi:DNA-directed RNA polymerase subunit RPC12/RpoP